MAPERSFDKLAAGGANYGIWRARMRGHLAIKKCVAALTPPAGPLNAADQAAFNEMDERARAYIIEGVAD